MKKLVILNIILLLTLIVFIQKRLSDSYTCYILSKKSLELAQNGNPSEQILSDLKVKLSTTSPSLFRELSESQIQDELSFLLSNTDDMLKIETIHIAQPNSSEVNGVNVYSFIAEITGSYKDMIILVNRIERQGLFFTCSGRFYMTTLSTGGNKQEILKLEIYFQSFIL